MPRLTLVGVVVTSILAAAPAADAASWTGTTYGRIQRTSKWAAGGTTMRGDFAFRTGARGAVRGYASVSYEPNFDTARINAFIDYAKSAASGALAPIPLLGALAGPTLNLAVGLSIRYPNLLTVHEGAIAGTLRKGSLTLRWVRPPRGGVPFSAYLLTVKESERLTSGRLPTQLPWRRSGRVIGRGVITSSSRHDSTSGGVREQARSYWSAHQVD